MFYSSEKNSFDDDHVDLLENMAENISFALDNFERDRERQRAEEILRLSEERFRSLTHLSSDFFWEQDAQLRMTAWEGKVADESNLRAIQGLLGSHLWEQESVRPDSISWKDFHQLLEDQKKFRDFEFAFTNDEGVVYHFSMSGEPVFDADGHFSGYRGICRDVTERKRSSDHIRYLATHDQLTGLPNRVLFNELLNQAILNAERYGRSFALLFVDLDHFKFINDNYGHHVGDEMLREAARRLGAPLRKSDVVARMGGDEFVILLQEVSSRPQIARVAESLLQAFAGPIQTDGKACAITASIGISIFGEDASDDQSLMQHADNAMYAAKAHGKNNYQFYLTEA